MNKLYIYLILFTLTTGLAVSCVTKKKKNETSKFGKFYQNTTAYYNGYWNSKEVLKESMLKLRAANVDDYNKILEVEDFISIDNPKMVKPEMDKILEKVTTVAQLHEASDWVDDCYVMMGKAQYLKQEFETAEETLEYFQEDFNPANPYGRNYKSKKPTGKAAKKAKEEKKKEQAEERKKLKEEKEEAAKIKAKTKEQEQKEKKRERERLKKEKERQRKIDAKNRKKGIKTKKSTPEVKPAGSESSTAPVKVNEEIKENEDEKPFEPVVKKPEEDKTAYSEGMLWLAKTYIKRENWFSSQMLLEKLESSAINDDIKSELPATYANLYIKQKRYEEAIPKLEEAITKAENKNLKARYSFIAGQISQLENNYDAALNYFTAAKKYTYNPKMEFMAELAVAKNGIISGKKTKESVLKDLERLLKQDKNAEVKDQIYFTMAEIELSQNNEETAVEYFKKSIANNFSDQKLKTESYYRIANLFYTKEKYLEAANYFDSTMMLLSNSDERYGLVKRYVTNLKEIANNLELIAYQDTILYFASLDPDNQEKAVKSYLARNKKKEPSEQQSGALITKQIGVRSAVDFGNSTFFAYNRNTKEKGKEEFDKIWKRRPLEDNWRRSSKSSNSENEANQESEKQALALKEEEKTKKDEYEKFLRELPSNPVKKQEANDKIMTAMFVLGKLFRDKIQNYEKSASTLENMHARYGPTQYELDSYFYLYLDYIDLANSTKANDYKNKIIKKYPDSKYASILSNPESYAKTNNAANKSEQYYQTVYGFFKNGQYAKALDAINQASSVTGEDNSYEAKMALLKAMCLGSTQGKDAYVKALNEVIVGYPNTEEQSKAKEIMRFLGGDKSAFANVQDVDKIYSRESDAIHYVAIITYDLEETRHVNFKVSISEYTKKNFKVERLQFGDASLNIDDNSQIILVRKFDSEAKAIEYYTRAVNDREEFTSGVDLTYDIFAISQQNYRKMLSERTAAGYRLFFETNILPFANK